VCEQHEQEEEEEEEDDRPVCCPLPARSLHACNEQAAQAWPATAGRPFVITRKIRRIRLNVFSERCLLEKHPHILIQLQSSKISSTILPPLTAFVIDESNVFYISFVLFIPSNFSFLSLLPLLSFHFLCLLRNEFYLSGNHPNEDVEKMAMIRRKF
jgi:hypothetical protein